MVEKWGSLDYSMYMRRFAEDFLAEWILSKNRKPLILRGARQVGKSTLVRLFAQSRKLKLVEINLEKEKLASLQKESINTRKIINEIQTRYDTTLDHQTLLFFDEIQKQPDLIPALRYFYEDHKHIPVISAGSLLEFELEKHEFQMPVGRIQYFHLGPMSFFEFLTALRKKNLIQNIVQSKFKLDEAIFIQLTELFQDYLYVGGMPEAVKVYAETKNPLEVRQIHRNIIQTYKDDFPKYAKTHQIENLQLVFEKIPSLVGQKNKFTNYSTDLRAREIKQCLHLLSLARIILPCYHSNCSGLPLLSQKDESVFKTFFLDVGLLNYLQGVSWQQMKLFSNALLTKGTIAEQFAAQHLAYKDQGLEAPQLFYWLRDKQTGKAELDFVIEQEAQITPIEIKSGSTGKLKSLSQFIAEKKIHTAIRFDLEFRKSLKQRIGSTQLVSYHLGLVEKIV
jgi:predicted AAA+ superfamily ATPase